MYAAAMKKKQALPGRPRGRLPLAREGYPFLLPCLGLLLAAMALQWVLPATLLFILFALMLNFFRDPERPTPREPGLFIAPADGKIVRADTDAEGARVDIFMNIFDVHVNRAPMSGRIVHMQYSPGSFLNAARERAATHNERNRIEMEADDGARLACTQIAGLVARRIVTYVAVGDRVAAGQRIGMIRFGSRVNCEIPAGFQLQVAPGEHVRAGESILARKVGGERKS